MKKDLYLCFIDYSKAFDRVRHDELYKILNSIDIDGKDLRIVRNLYWDQTAATRIDDEISEYKPIKGGVRQGCVLSPDFFNISSEMILRNIYDLKGIIRIGGVNINNLRYADDTVLVAESESELQAILDVVTDTSMEMGLDLNAKRLSA
ncbi:retrovirus-related Pol polyprotein LINE-1 [Elysia marginata]|uniref:Retrovirus-related Pol polyprotein LINE-1 n=1 Tax=Elysia marginata TaxID=1093978 RepID=A0AAV4I6L5_9GAST|nr:retrovirus-related Pol polyprotein LINE-1 [Elysia marginata]